MSKVLHFPLAFEQRNLFCKKVKKSLNKPEYILGQKH